MLREAALPLALSLWLPTDKTSVALGRPRGTQKSLMLCRGGKSEPKEEALATSDW